MLHRSFRSLPEISLRSGSNSNTVLPFLSISFIVFPFLIARPVPGTGTLRAGPRGVKLQCCLHVAASRCPFFFADHIAVIDPCLSQIRFHGAGRGGVERFAQVGAAKPVSPIFRTVAGSTPVPAATAGVRMIDQIRAVLRGDFVRASSKMSFADPKIVLTHLSFPFLCPVGRCVSPSRGA